MFTEKRDNVNKIVNPSNWQLIVYLFLAILLGGFKEIDKPRSNGAYIPEKKIKPLLKRLQGKSQKCPNYGYCA